MDEYDKELLRLLQTDNLKTSYASILNATTPLWGALVAWLWLRNRLSGSGVAGRSAMFHATSKAGVFASWRRVL